MNTLRMFHVRWFGSSIELLPLTTEKTYCVAAQFKAQGYRSFANHIDTVSDAHKEQYPWGDELDRARRRSLQSTQRGIGPSRQCFEVPISDVHSLLLPADPLVPAGPICPGEWAVVSAFHMTRGAESSCARADSVSINEASKTYSWKLPVAKEDPQATGCVRSWGCVCNALVSGPCPYHAMLTLRREALSRFGQNGCLPPDLPLFPDSDGNWVTRRGFIATLESLAASVGVPLRDELGRCTAGEHVWRVTGARHLAALDIPTAIIMRVARWGSSVVFRYLADAPLSALTRIYVDKVRLNSQASAALIASSAVSGSSPAGASAENLLEDALQDDDGPSVYGWVRHRITHKVHVIASIAEGFAGEEETLTLCKWHANPRTTQHLLALPADARLCTDCLKAQVS